jgi:copper(I)-binding protein
VKLFVTRTSAATLAACGLTAALTLTGCGAGQITQTSTQHPAVNGNNAWVGNPTTGIALRNLHLRATQTSDYVKPGATVELLFVAVNESVEQPDRLVSITSPVGTVDLTGDLKLPVAGTLVVGTPDGQPSPLDATEAADTAEAAVTLTQPISNGLTYPFTFTFERSGQKEVQVPISAGEAPRREAGPSGGSSDSGTAAETGSHG